MSKNTVTAHFISGSYGIDDINYFCFVEGFSSSATKVKCTLSGNLSF